MTRCSGRSPVARRSIAAPPLPLQDVYERLHSAYADQHWHWHPGHVQSPFDVIAGAVLVQHTTWQSAERALEALRGAGALCVDSLLALPEDRLIELVRVSGTPNLKAKRLRAVAEMLRNAGGLEAFLALPADPMREQLLATHGIGRESADAIMLYAAGVRVFVVDQYTRRLFSRLGIGPAQPAPYEEWRAWFERALPDAGAEEFARYHAYIVLHG